MSTREAPATAAVLTPGCVRYELAAEAVRDRSPPFGARAVDRWLLVTGADAVSRETHCAKSIPYADRGDRAGRRVDVPGTGSDFGSSKLAALRLAWAVWVSGPDQSDAIRRDWARIATRMFSAAAKGRIDHGMPHREAHCDSIWTSAVFAGRGLERLPLRSTSQSDGRRARTGCEVGTVGGVRPHSGSRGEVVTPARCITCFEELVAGC